MGYKDYIQPDASECAEKLEAYGYTNIPEFLNELSLLKTTIVDSISIYLGFPCNTSEEEIFRRTLDRVDEILGKGGYGESLFPLYTDAIIPVSEVPARVEEIQKRLGLAFKHLGEDHRASHISDIATRLETHARFKTFYKTLWSSPGAMNIIVHEMVSPENTGQQKQ